MADDATVRDVVRFLSQYHGREIGEVAAGVYVQAFANTNPDLLADAVRRWCDTHAPSALLPAASDIRVCCRDVIASRRGEEKRDTPGTTAVAPSRQRAQVGIARATAALVRRARLPEGHPERLDGAGVAAEMRRLDGEFPGCGWYDMAAHLEATRAVDQRETRMAQRRYADLGLRIGRGFGVERTEGLADAQ